jgi:hypothetical protein
MIPGLSYFGGALFLGVFSYCRDRYLVLLLPYNKQLKSEKQ